MPSTSEKQRRFFRMVLAHKEGRLEHPTPEIVKASDSMTIEQIRHYLVLEKDANKVVNAHLN